MTVLSPVGAQNVWDNGGGANAGDIPTHRRYSLNEFGEVTSITPPIDPTVNSGFMQPVSCLPSHGFPDPTGQFPQEMEGVHGFAGDPTPFVPPHGFGPQQESWQGAMLTQPSQTSQVSFNPDPENVPLYEQQQKEQQLLYNMSS
ncbi:hypothetical protein QFC19_001450 [Naganishia cerealis]|uniref:Uncharacterized protein n=1 Tax=Naganishia cerealis TaxID=610337 RepID=A0ACC2WIG2_9TREE|nr:hypothetical protein QFC19_001450 [Naganishia cerealis]